ncbi:MAG: hypothetical protein OEV42_03090 [Deltaproteobacteria bacterium]|nr:hypothetical protein [Deltaproteobacteria bacterium]
MINLQDKGTKLTAVAIIIVAGVITIYLSAVDPTFKLKPFNEAAWKSGDARSRGEMVNDLLNSPVLVNKSMEEVKKLLGPGETRKKNLYYPIELGVKVGFQPSVFELAIIFDRHSRAIDWEIIEQGKVPEKISGAKGNKGR